MENSFRFLLFSVICVSLSQCADLNSYEAFDVVKAEIIVQQNKFNSFGFNDYTFSSYKSCECLPCSTNKKFINVVDDEVIDIEFEDNGNDCTEKDLYDDDYRSINDWFNIAIEYAETWSKCDDEASTNSSDDCTDKSLELIYDETYGFPTEIIFDREAMAYDGGRAYGFGDFAINEGGNLWDDIKAEIIEQQNLFNNWNIDKYSYSSQPSCFCISCFVTKKIITVVDDEVTNIEFAENDDDCGDEDLSDDDYKTINDWFNLAIEYAEQWRICDETTTTTESPSLSFDSCKDKSLELVYDDTYGFPTEIIFDRAAMAYDGGMAYYFGDFAINEGGNLWDDIKAELVEQQTKFNSFDFDEYLFSSSRSCECLPCGSNKKFIKVVDDEVIDIEFEDNGNECTEDDLYEDDYRTINDWFNVAIEYTETWRKCDETSTTSTTTTESPFNSDDCRDRGLAVEYDETYGFPIEMIFDPIATAYDGGMWYDFDCFDPYDGDERLETLETFSRSCDVEEPTLPSKGNKIFISSFTLLWISLIMTILII